MSNEFNHDFYDESKDAAWQESSARSLASAIPQRVKSGTADTNGLFLETSNGSLRCEWTDVELICLGIIKYERDDGKGPKSKIRQAIRQNLFGEDKAEKPPEYLVSNLLDIYVREHVAPFRIDSSSINYKNFITTPGYISAINFRRLVKQICYYATSASLDPNLVAFLFNKKERINSYISVYAFQDACLKMKKGSARLIPRNDVAVEMEEASPWGDSGGWE